LEHLAHSFLTQFPVLAAVDWFTELTPYFETGSYVAVFVVLVLCGIGLPIPEELTFITAGYVVHRVEASIWIMIVVALAGIVAGDSVTFYLGRKLGSKLLLRWPFNRVLTQQGLERSRAFFDKHGSKAVFIAGFMAGVRAPTFFLCGSMGLSYPRFVLFDFARAVVSCPVSIVLGYLFGQHAIAICHHFFRPIVVVLVLCVVVALVRWYARHRREQLAHVQAPAAAPPSLQAKSDNKAET
jgi:membrane protein DedA with SNARE-associated domain